jgi:hypothetical protein
VLEDRSTAASQLLPCLFAPLPPTLERHVFYMLGS